MLHLVYVGVILVSIFVQDVYPFPLHNVDLNAKAMLHRWDADALIRILAPEGFEKTDGRWMKTFKRSGLRLDVRSDRPPIRFG